MGGRKFGSKRWGLVIGSLLMVTALVAAGCSDDDDDNGSSNGSDTPELTGDPIRIASIASETGQAITQPEVAEAIRVAEAGVNARGGINGRPLEIELCDDQATADGALSCARDIQEDPTIVASVGGTSVAGQDYGELLAESGVALIGPYPSAAWELTVGTSYPFIGGTVPNFFAMGALGQEYERVVLFRVDIAESEQVPLLIQGAGLELAETIAIPVNAPDVSSYVTQGLEGGTDAVILALAEPLTSQVIQGVYQQGGDDVTVLATGDQLNENTIEALGPAADALRGVLTLPPPSAADDFDIVADFNEDREEYGSDEAVGNSLSLNAYASIRWFAEEAAAMLDEGLELTQETVLARMNAVTDATLLGLTTPVNFTAPIDIPGLPFTRLFNTNGYTVTANSEDGWVLESTTPINFMTGQPVG